MQRFVNIVGALGILTWCLLVPSAAAFMAAVVFALFVFRPKKLLFVFEIPDAVLAPIIFFLVARVAVATGNLKELGFPFVYVLTLTALSCTALFFSRKLEDNFLAWFSWALGVLCICAFISVLLGGIAFPWLMYVSVVNLVVSLSLWWFYCFLRRMALDD